MKGKGENESGDGEGEGRGGDILPSIKARRSACRLKPPYLLNLERSGVGGIFACFPSGKAQVHHCCLEDDKLV